MTGTQKKVAGSSIPLGYRADAVPFPFRGDDGQPPGCSVDLCRRVAVAAVERAPSLRRIEMRWVPVTPEKRIGQIAGGGTGQTIVTTVGGAVAGSALTDRTASETAWIVNIRFEDGVDRAVTVTQRPNCPPGDRVRVDDGLVRPLARR